MNHQTKVTYFSFANGLRDPITTLYAVVMRHKTTRPVETAKGFASIANQNLVDLRLCPAHRRIGGTVFLIG
jgi:hypothetical protein